MNENDSTRDRLLDAAEVLFAEQGFTAASIRDITQSADCNVAAVNYHFGSKEKLYREVFRRRLSQLREQRVQAVEQAGGGDQPASLQEILKAFVTAFLEPLLESGEDEAFFALMVREMHNPHLPPELLQEEMVAPVQMSLGGALRRACPGLSERQAQLTVFSLVAQLIHVLHIRRMAMAGAFGGADVNELMEHITAFTAGAICAQVSGGKG